MKFSLFPQPIFVSQRQEYFCSTPQVFFLIFLCCLEALLLGGAKLPMMSFECGFQFFSHTYLRLVFEVVVSIQK